ALALDTQPGLHTPRAVRSEADVFALDVARAHAIAARLETRLLASPLATGHHAREGREPQHGAGRARDAPARAHGGARRAPPATGTGTTRLETRSLQAAHHRAHDPVSAHHRPARVRKPPRRWFQRR